MSGREWQGLLGRLSMRAKIIGRKPRGNPEGIGGQGWRRWAQMGAGKRQGRFSRGAGPERGQSRRGNAKHRHSFLVGLGPAFGKGKGRGGSHAERGQSGTGGEWGQQGSGCGFRGRKGDKPRAAPLTWSTPHASPGNRKDSRMQPWSLRLHGRCDGTRSGSSTLDFQGSLSPASCKSFHPPPILVCLGSMRGWCKISLGFAYLCA